MKIQSILALVIGASFVLGCAEQPGKKKDDDKKDDKKGDKKGDDKKGEEKADEKKAEVDPPKPDKADG